MTIKSVIWVIGLNTVILVCLIPVFRRQISKGRLNENKIAVLACGYMSFVFISIWLPSLINYTYFSSVIYLIPPVIYLLLVWCIGYPWFRWICRRINLRNHP